jgi:hypothetical protein
MGVMKYRDKLNFGRHAGWMGKSSIAGALMMWQGWNASDLLCHTRSLPKDLIEAFKQAKTIEQSHLPLHRPTGFERMHQHTPLRNTSFVIKLSRRRTATTTTSSRLSWETTTTSDREPVDLVGLDNAFAFNTVAARYAAADMNATAGLVKEAETDLLELVNSSAECRKHLCWPGG